MIERFIASNSKIQKYNLNKLYSEGKQTILNFFASDEDYIINKGYEILGSHLGNYIVKKSGKMYIWRGKEFGKDKGFFTIDGQKDFDNIIFDEENLYSTLYIFCQKDKKIAYDVYNGDKIKIYKISEFDNVNFKNDNMGNTLALLQINGKTYIYDIFAKKTIVINGIKCFDDVKIKKNNDGELVVSVGNRNFIYNFEFNK